MSKLTTLISAALFMALTGMAQASEFKTGDITVSNPWARASMGMARSGGGYLTLKNTGKSDDKLVSASSKVSKKTELHTHIMANGIMKMRQVKDITVPAGGMTMLKPGGLHIMFIGLHDKLKQGESFPLTLNFEKSGSVEVIMSIKAGGAMSHDAMMKNHGNMKMDMKMDMKKGMKMDMKKNMKKAM